MRALKWVPALSLLGLFAAASEAQAVVIVIGGGAAQQCYATAEYGDPFDAFEICSKALTDQALSVRDRAATYVNRSVIRLRVKDFNGAITDCDQGITRAPNMSEAHVNRGAALLNLNRPREALVELDVAITMGLDKLHLAYYNRGLTKERLNDPRGAYADYKKALEIDPTFTLAADELKRFSVNGMPVRS
jgi:tetratricopeptide (TPR) repeat protein